MTATITDYIRNIINEKCYLTENKDGTFTGEIYVDYRDELDRRSIKKIFSSDNPREIFEDMLNEAFWDSEWEHQEEIIKIIENYFHAENQAILYHENETYICDWVQENVYFNYPYSHYLNQKFCVDIIVDTGDENHDYVLNCAYPHYNGDYEENIDNLAAITWITRQQGYTKTQLNQALKFKKYNDSKYLKSIREEILNCSTHMNALTFFVSISLGECFDLIDKIKENNKNDDTGGYRTIEKRKGKASIILDKRTPCGLYDCWSGAGSILDIELDKDVILPLKYISSALPDGCRGYGINNIYGMLEDFWEKDCIKIA